VTHAQPRRDRSSLGIAVSVILAIVAAVGSFMLYRPHGSGASLASDPAGSAGDPAGQAQPPGPVPGARRHADPLGGQAASFLGTRDGTVLAAVYDLNSGQTWTAGHGPPQAEASVVKLDILETLLAQRGRDGRGLSGQEQSLARLMIEQSDDNAATVLWKAAGGASGIRSFNSAAGLTRTAPSPCVVCTGFPLPGWGLTTTTPADQILLLRQIVQQGPLLSNAQRSYALRLMEDVSASQRWGVSGGVSPKATVALKDGWLPLDSARTDWQINSVGWVSGRGRNYLIAVLSTGNPTEQYGIDTISSLSSMVWKNMR
jgi:Beta-lactamase enzyme family